MRILGIKAGHDGGIAYVDEGTLVFSLEAEKDSGPRFGELDPKTLFEALELAPGLPDIIAVGGWHKDWPGPFADFRAGYSGLEAGSLRGARLLGADVQLFTSSHERSHLFMAAGMHPRAPIKDCATLVWEGGLGAFYRWRNFGSDIERHHVMTEPGAKFAAIFAIADPTFTGEQDYPRLEDAGKMMALAAYGRDLECELEDRIGIKEILDAQSVYPFHKRRYDGSGLFDCGLDTPRFWAAANYASRQIFETFREAASGLFEQGELPLLISGGCGLNCDWNEAWRRSGQFADIFVPPCTNDSGLALGTAIDAMVHVGSQCRLEWSVFAGPEFCNDVEPNYARWRSQALDCAWLSTVLTRGEVVAWVQGRCEIGPRALGHRSLLANAGDPAMRMQLNAIKGRESYRPIAPCCRSEDISRWFETTGDDPYMLFFAQVRSDGLPSVTHVDGTARVQSVDRNNNVRLHELLGRFERESGFGVLCNTSLNFPGRGFINRMSDLVRYCEDRQVDVFVVNDRMYVRRDDRLGTGPAYLGP